jgi:hypothetical protein
MNHHPNTYRAAVCLNNYGASLLARGQAREAAIVLRDSLVSMNLAFQSSSEKSVSLTNNISVSNMLHFATKCMVDRPTKKGACVTDYEMNVLRHSGEFALHLDETLYKQRNVIMIDDFDNEKEAVKDHVHTNMNIHTAIIVYNTAMARLTLASVKGSASIRVAVKKACVKLLRWAYGIVSRSLQVQSREATQLSVLILSRLSELLNEMGDHAEATKVSLARNFMENSFQSYESIVPSRTDAAAAA